MNLLPLSALDNKHMNVHGIHGYLYLTPPEPAYTTKLGATFNAALYHKLANRSNRVVPMIVVLDLLNSICSGIGRILTFLCAYYNSYHP